MAVDWAHIRASLPYERTPEQKEKRKQLFKQMDAGNGIMSLAEVDKGIRDVLNCGEIFDAKPAIMRAFMAAKSKSKGSGKGNDDYIEFREFRFFLECLRQYFEYWIAFERIDTDDDKRIDLEEFKSAVGKVNAETNLTIDDPEATFKKIDKNGGGFILFNEFFQWCVDNQLDLNDDDD